MYTQFLDSKSSDQVKSFLISHCKLVYWIHFLYFLVQEVLHPLLFAYVMCCGNSFCLSTKISLALGIVSCCKFYILVIHYMPSELLMLKALLSCRHPFCWSMKGMIFILPNELLRFITLRMSHLQENLQERWSIAQRGHLLLHQVNCWASI